MAGLAWLIANEPSPALWLMPSENLARSFSKSRWLPMLEDSPTMLECFPAEGWVAAGDKGGARVATGRLPQCPP